MTATLAIDTASADIALAFRSESGALQTLVRAGERDHSRLLLGLIEEITAGDVASVGLICAVKGPGNYSGLRVGIATARGLALSLGVPLVGVETHECIAHAASLPGDWLAIHPAGRKEYAVRRCSATTIAGSLYAVGEGAFTGVAFAGETAGSLGGVEISPGQRVAAALALASTAPNLDDAVYLRAPNVTRPRLSPQPSD